MLDDSLSSIYERSKARQKGRQFIQDEGLFGRIGVRLGGGIEDADGRNTSFRNGTRLSWKSATPTGVHIGSRRRRNPRQNKFIVGCRRARRRGGEVDIDTNAGWKVRLRRGKKDGKEFENQ